MFRRLCQPALGSLGRLDRSDTAIGNDGSSKCGSHPGPSGEGSPRLCRDPHGLLTAGSGRTKGRIRAATSLARDEGRVLTPHQPIGCGGTSPTPLLAGTGRWDSWTMNALKRAAAWRFTPPSAPGGAELRGRRFGPPIAGQSSDRLCVPPSFRAPSNAGQGSRRRSLACWVGRAGLGDVGGSPARNIHRTSTSNREDGAGHRIARRRATLNKIA